MSVAAEMSRLFPSIKVKTDADQHEERERSASATTSRKRSNSDQHKRSRKLPGKKAKSTSSATNRKPINKDLAFLPSKSISSVPTNKKGWNLRTKISLFMDSLLKDIGVREIFELESLTSSDQLSFKGLMHRNFA